MIANFTNDMHIIIIATIRLVIALRVKSQSRKYKQHLSCTMPNACLRRMETGSAEATLPVSGLSPFIMGLNSSEDRIGSPRRKIFQLGSKFFPCRVNPKVSKQKVIKVVPLYKMRQNHGCAVIPYKFYVLGQIGLSKQCRPRSDCFRRSSLIRVYAVCHSSSIFWMH